MRIKKMETEVEIEGKAYVHWKASVMMNSI